GPCLSSLVADQPLSPATHHCLGRPLPHQLTNTTYPYQLAKALRLPFIAETKNAAPASYYPNFRPNQPLLRIFDNDKQFPPPLTSPDKKGEKQNKKNSYKEQGEEFRCFSEKITSIDVSNNSNLTTLVCLSYIENENFIEPEKTSLINRYRTYYPEMSLIDISDLNQLAAQVNEQTANDESFLKQICPLEPEKFIRNEAGNFCEILERIANRILARCLIVQNRLVWGKDEEYEREINRRSLKYLFTFDKIAPKHPLGAYIPNRQRLVKKVLAGDQELTDRLKDLYDKEKELKIIRED
ncbi:4376_t:CDS:2, partial [Racocetra persica]